MIYVKEILVSNLDQFIGHANRNFFRDTWQFKLRFYNYTVLLRGILGLLCERRILKTVWTEAGRDCASVCWKGLILLLTFPVLEPTF
jgi:hypothetical protein